MAKISNNLVVSGTSPLVAQLQSQFQDETGFAYYYSLGLQIPIGRIDVFADYTGHVFSSDVTSNEITGGLRFRF